ncbi:sensor histidine kinase [Aquimarina rubra]|uniref:Sensor histidine kinase n=1 Tax=Aquimarina rubra TaxID=1920033 RepID=A0ABW5L999_9FLAO
MKKLLHYIKENNKFILFLFAFSWVLTLKDKIGIASSWDDFVFHMDTSFWVFLNAFFIFIGVDFIKKNTDKNYSGQIPSVWKYLKFFGISFICYIVFINVLSVLISVGFNNFSRNFNSSYQITYRVFRQIIDFMIFGSFSFVYLYYKENKNYKKQLNEYRINNSKSKIRQLKAQLNPHFLFNNLNILDQFIEEDKEKASEFLSQFSELYRYALRNSDKELISIQEELMFIESYFELMEKKYVGCYQLIIEDTIKNSDRIVPPFCLQVLVENAIVHNLGTTENPVIINITSENGIKIKNNKVEQHRKKKGNGVALKNLSKQFELLINTAINIQETEVEFAVTLPFIKMNTND